MKIVSLNPRSSEPKYRQIIQSVEQAIAAKLIRRGDKLPSVTKVALEFSLSRDTVLLAYDELKKRGIIYARMGKGYYVKSEAFSPQQRIFLLFDEFNSFKEDLYNSFNEAIGDIGQVDIFFHYFNTEVFKKLVNENNGDYSRYVIMPANLKNVGDIIKKLPENDVYILDQTTDELRGYPSVHQNFVNDIYKALTEGRERLQKYRKLVLLFPSFKQPPGMKEGFIAFCHEHALDFEILPDFDPESLKPGIVYVIPNDRHLVQVIEETRSRGLAVGTDIGIISYNDTPLKKVVGNGITTISTDFKAMGRLLAEMIVQNTRLKIANQSRLIIRGSL